MPLAKSGYTENTPKNYLIDSAVVFTNLTYSEANGFEGTLIGATQGGVNVKIEENYRNPEVDGTSQVQGKVVGNVILESALASAVINLKEITAENLKKGMNGSIADALTTEAPAGYKILKTKSVVESTDHLTNIAISGTLAGTSNPIIVILDNPLFAGGIELATEDNGEAVVELTAEAHATVAQLASKEFPWRILFPAIA